MPIGGPHLAVRERKEVGWWAGGMGLLGRGEKKRGEGEMWAGLGREKKEFFLTQTSFEQNSFENKLNLNFGCYKSYPLKKNLVLDILIDWRTTEGILP